MKVGLSPSSAHPSLERMTARKEPQKLTEDSTERKHAPQDLYERLQQRKRQITAEEQQAKQSIRRVMSMTGTLLESFQAQLEQQLSAVSLRLFERIEEYCALQVSELREKEIEDLLDYNLRLNAVEESEVRLRLEQCLYVLPLPNQPNERMTKEKYQQMIDRLRRKLEGHILVEQKVKEDRRELERDRQRLHTSVKQPKPIIFLERYEQENAALLEQNMKLVNSTLELTRENKDLKEQLQLLDDDKKQITQRLHRVSSNSEKLEAKLNMPDRKVLEENRVLQKQCAELQEQNERLQNEMLSTKEDSLQVANRLMAVSAESHSNRAYAEKLKQQLESELGRAVEERNKHEHLHNLYRLLQEEKDDLLRNQASKSQENAELRQEKDQLALKLRRLEEQLQEAKNKLSQEAYAKTEVEMSMRKAEQSRIDFRQILERESELKDCAVRDKQLLLERVHVLETSLEGLRKEKAKAMEQKSQTEAALSALRAENQSILSDLKTKESMALQLKGSLTSLQNELAAKTSKMETAKKKEERAKKHAEEITELEMSFALRTDYLSKEVAALRAQFETLRQSYQTRRKLHQARCKALKDRFAAEVLAVFEKQSKKVEFDGGQLAERLIESFSNLIHKESIIAKLKEEKGQLSQEIQQMKQKAVQEERRCNKAKKEPKSHTMISASKLKPHIESDKKAEEIDADIKQLGSSLSIERALLQKAQAEEQTKITEERLLTVEGKARKLEVMLEAANKVIQELQGKGKDLERKLRQDRQETTIRMLQGSVVAEQEELRSEILQARADLDQLRGERDEFRDDANRKKDYIATLKKDQKDIEARLKQLQSQLDQEKEEHAKSKKTIKEYQRKEQVFRDNKDKLEGLRTLEKENGVLKRSLEDAVKQHKQDLAKKDGIIRMLKEKEACSETFMRESQQDITHVQMLEEELNSQLRKVKAELERKDMLVKTLRQKISKLEDDLEKERRQNERRMQKDRLDLDRESRRSEQLKLQNKTLDSQLFSFRNIIKRLGKLLMECQASSASVSTSTYHPVELSLYEQSLSILQLGADDLKSFLPEASKENRNTLNTTALKDLDKALAADEIDGGAVLNILEDQVRKIARKA